MGPVYFAYGVKVMKIKQAWGWLMAGVVAAGLNATYHDGGLQWAHQAIERVDYNTRAVLALASGNAQELLNQAQMLTTRNETASCPLSRAIARIASNIVRTETVPERFDVMSAREEAQLARLETNRARIEARVARIRIRAAAFQPMISPAVSVTCPRVHVTVPRIPRVNIPMVRIPAPVVHVEGMGSGPV